jgi:hypothetical protein
MTEEKGPLVRATTGLLNLLEQRLVSPEPEPTTPLPQPETPAKAAKPKAKAAKPKPKATPAAKPKPKPEAPAKAATPKAKPKPKPKAEASASGPGAEAIHRLVMPEAEAAAPARQTAAGDTPYAIGQLATPKPKATPKEVGVGMAERNALLERLRKSLLEIDASLQEA